MRRRAIIAVAVLLGAVVSLVGVRAVARSRTFQLFGDLLARVEVSEPLVALTFDDGPTADRVGTVVAMLAPRRVRATFFVTGDELAAVPEAGRTLVAAGHELGNHTYSHRRMFLKSPGFARDELDQTDALIRAAGYTGPIAFRPPYGWKFLVLPWVLARTGRTSVTWDVEPDSYPDVAASSARITAHVLERVRPGSIVLLHIWYPSRQTSLDAVPSIVDGLQAKGYRFVTVRELLRMQRR
jgi:peptidoglycan/xylan/chitin deacetylase (PgdA/CDA1 family)